MPDHYYQLYIRVRFCQMFPGWTLEYAQSVIERENDLKAILAIISGQNKAAQHRQEQAKNRNRR